MLKNLIVKSDGTEIDSSLILSCNIDADLEFRPGIHDWKRMHRRNRGRIPCAR